MKKIIIKSDKVSLPAELFDTPTANTIYNMLPIKGMASDWGEEIYFDVYRQIELEDDAREDVEVGELGYWPVGSAFCIFYGRTPISDNNKPKAYSPVNVFGKIIGDATLFRQVEPGEIISVEKFEG